MSNGKFKKGNVPWNKGMKGLRVSPHSEFKKGDNAGEKGFNWKGGVQKPKNDCIHLYDGVGKRIRNPKKTYEDFHGKLEEGMVIYHKDGNKHNDDISNLEAITRAELLKRNRNKN